MKRPRAGTKLGRPRTRPPTERLDLRLDAHLLDLARREADRTGETLTALVERALRAIL